MNADYTAALGAAIRDRRTQIRRQQGAVAGLAGTDQRTLRRLEDGAEPVTDVWLPSLAYALSTTPALLRERARRIHTDRTEGAA